MQSKILLEERDNQLYLAFQKLPLNSIQSVLNLPGISKFQNLHTVWFDKQHPLPDTGSTRNLHEVCYAFHQDKCVDQYLSFATSECLAGFLYIIYSYIDNECKLTYRRLIFLSYLLWTT